ncbi:hypothetical protein Bbelb_166010 [Branchiostoma belcheri]|nr:hypothetical protein Bbelb_166010 [Branchiostoma belcheri]
MFQPTSPNPQMYIAEKLAYLHPNTVRPLNLSSDKSSSSCHRRTFIPATVKLWNCLPQDIVNTRDLPNFKRKVNAYLSATRQRPYSKRYSGSAAKLRTWPGRGYDLTTDPVKNSILKEQVIRAS